MALQAKFHSNDWQTHLANVRNPDVAGVHN